MQYSTALLRKMVFFSVAFGYKGRPEIEHACGRPMDATTDTPTKTSDAEHHPRVEDDALVRGLGRYIADAPAPDQAFAFFVRSPHAFARITSIDTEAANNAPGVIAVLTGSDMEGVGNISRHPPLPGRNGSNRGSSRFLPQILEPIIAP